MKISRAKEIGAFEPVSLYPVVDQNRCIKSGACIKACPEHDVLGIRNGKATTINASRCIGHGACFLACPVEAITLWMGTEQRGVEIPEVSTTFESNVPGVYIAGELGGMGLIKNAVNQGKEAVENIAKSIHKKNPADYDLIVIGAGPAGISATLTGKKHNLKVLTLEQNTLGGTISSFPRSKIVMTSPMDLPLHGKVKLVETSKPELLDLWVKVLKRNNISIKENTKVETIIAENDIFTVKTKDGAKYYSKTILLAIGRRGSPRKLNIPGENAEKVAYRLLEPENIENKNILVVGGGDSAVEATLQLAEQNNVTLSYRAENFSRLKVKNHEKINNAIQRGLIDVKFNSTVISIQKNYVEYTIKNSSEVLRLDNDLVYVFAGGELPTDFLKEIGIHFSTKHGERILKHK
jgi:thioredoxin reductase